jgi:parallel beta-helix repeat protein
MKTHIFLAVALFVFTSSFGTTYFVSNSGVDINDGKSETSAVATLAFAKTKIKAHDTLLLRRGDVFRETLSLSSIADPTIGAFGPAGLAKPVISGSTAIAQWTSSGTPGVWTASCGRNIQNLYADNTLMTLARYPDTGWLRIDTMTENDDGSNTVVTVAALTKHPRNAANYWTNAQIRWRRWSWWYETRRVTSYDASGRLALAGASIIHIMGTKGWGFYIDKKMEELDAPCEWFYDSTVKKVCFYPPGGKDPNTMLVEGSYLPTGLTIAGGTVDNVCFRQQTLKGLELSKTSVVSNCRFEAIGGDSGGYGLLATWDIANSHIYKNVFANNLNIGLAWYENSGRQGKTVIEYDTLVNTGSVPGYGGSGTWHAVGILVHLSKNVQVQYNYIDKTGYAGVLLGSDSNFVQYNIIKNAMYTLNDGAGIHTDCSKSFIHNNIILDTKGDLTSSGPWYPLGHGIWLEFLGDNRESVVENNTITRSGCNGIYLPNNFSCTVKNNVLFDNAVAQLELDGQLTNSSTGRTANLPQNNQFAGNVCYAVSRQQKSLQFRPEYQYGAMQANYFCNPFTDSVVSGYGTGNNQWRLYDYTLSQWNQLYSWADKTAKTDPLKRPRGLAEANPYARGRLFINDSPLEKSFSLGATAFVDLDGKPVTGQVIVPAFYSKILVQADSSNAVMQKQQQMKHTPDLEIIRAGATGIYYRLNRRSAFSMYVYNQSGRLVYHWSSAAILGLHHADLSGFAPGVYCFTVSTSPCNQIKGKFILMR